MREAGAFQTVGGGHFVAVLLLGSALVGPVFGQKDTLDSTWDSLPDYESTQRWKPELTIDRSTLNGKVVCGYQGWFAAEGDGSGQGWRHYKGRGKFGPGSFTFDYWPDIEACQKADLDYMPVIWPGFSWHNLKRDSGKEEKLDKIPRLGGKFFWKQAVGARKSGAKMLYVAMFDEVDEGTQIFKVTNTPPEPRERFATYHGLPSDHYLWLTGEIGKMLRRSRQPSPELPER